MKPLPEGQIQVFYAGSMGIPELEQPNVTWVPGLSLVDNGNLIDFGFVLPFFFFSS